MEKPQRKPENLASLVKRVTFHNQDSGFCVLRVKARGQRDLITVVGHAATIGVRAGVQFRGDLLGTAAGVEGIV